MPSEEIAKIIKLPSREERLSALAQTGLVREFEKGDWHEGLCIESGHIVPPGPQWGTPFPFDFLKHGESDAQFESEVKEVLLSRNRVVLQGDLAKSLSFLREQGDSVKYIKRLDIQFSQADAIDHWDKEPVEAWKQLSCFISDELNIEDLDLALDTGICYEDYMEMGVRAEHELHFLPEVHEEIVNILAKALNGKRPKSLWIYWAAFFEMEAQGEKQIMGPDYDSIALGKVPRTERSYYAPRIRPDEGESHRGMSWS